MKNVQFRSEKTYFNVCETEPTQNKVIKSISFSENSKYIAIILEGPEFSAIAWDWHNKTKSRMMGQFDFGKTVVSKITFNPNDSHQVCTSGHNHWKLWRIQENTFKPMPNFHGVGNHIFTDHCWLGDDRLAGCTSEGEIIILEEFNQKQIIENAFMSDDIYGVTCIQPYSKGFFIGSDDGMMALWVRAEENNKGTSQDNS